MDQMLKTDYHAQIETKASPGEAWNAVSRVTAWWTANVEGPTKSLNDIFTVRFGETFSVFKIVAMTPAKRVVWDTLDCNLHWMKDKKEWKGTQIVWEVVPVEGGSRIEMTHVGLRPGIECFEDCQKGWNHYVKESLFKLIEKGKGDPDHRDYSALERQ